MHVSKCYVTLGGCDIIYRENGRFHGIDYTENTTPTNATYGEYSAHLFTNHAQSLISMISILTALLVLLLHPPLLVLPLHDVL